jgi:hypothetical protein
MKRGKGGVAQSVVNAPYGVAKRRNRATVELEEM